MNSLVRDDWGAERSAWLANLSYATAIVAGISIAAILIFLFRVPILSALTYPLRPLAPIARSARLLLLVTPLAQGPLRRYLYVGRHLATT